MARGGIGLRATYSTGQPAGRGHARQASDMNRPVHLGDGLGRAGRPASGQQLWMSGAFGIRRGSLAERHERGYAPAVGFVLLPKALNHPSLLQSKLAPQRPPNDQHDEYTAPIAAGHGRTHEGHQ
jgi:hypothetical protein